MHRLGTPSTQASSVWLRYGQRQRQTPCIVREPPNVSLIYPFLGICFPASFTFDSQAIIHFS